MYCTKCGNEMVNGVCPVCYNSVSGNTWASNTSVPNDVHTMEPPIVNNNIVEGQENKVPPTQQAMPTQNIGNDSEYEKQAYRASAEKYWYCFLFPILFFIPILNENKTAPGNIDVANNALWIFILNIAASFLYGITSGYVAAIFGLLSAVCSIFALVAFICAVSGSGIKVPVLGDVKIIKWYLKVSE